MPPPSERAYPSASEENDLIRPSAASTPPTSSKPSVTAGVTSALTPPATTTSASPVRSACTPECTATSELEQAVSTATEGPRKS